MTRLLKQRILLVFMLAAMAAPRAAQAAPGNVATELENVFIGVAEKVKPSVVNISVTMKMEMGHHGIPGFEAPFGDEDNPGDEFMDRFFDGMPGPDEPQGMGSGFIIDARGYIITNAHVVEDAETITVNLDEDTKVEGELVGIDKNTDLAVIKIETDQKLVPLEFADSENVKVGQWVIAVGNPFGLEKTVTVGIISAKGRHIGQGNYDDFLQTDAAINPGNSGGPLVNLDGEVVGVNTAIFTNAGGNMGIGFAIPANMANDIYAQLLEHGRWVRGWLGVYIQDLDDKLARQFKAPNKNGVLITEIIDDSPATAAGLKRGDVIISFDGHSVKNMNELMKVVAFTPVNKDVELVILRKGKEMHMSITVAERPEDEQIAGRGGQKGGPSVRPQKDILGVTVDNIPEEIMEQLDLESGEGVIILKVEPGSPAHRAELKKGDIIAEIQNEPVSDAASYRKLIADVKKGDEVLLLVMRDGHAMYVVVNVDEDEK